MNKIISSVTVILVVAFLLNLSKLGALDTLNSLLSSLLTEGVGALRGV